MRRRRCIFWRAEVARRLLAEVDDVGRWEREGGMEFLDRVMRRRKEYVL